MAKDQLTFNDLPTVVGELCDRIASMENLLSENISRQSAPQENTHVPMTVQEACEYLRMPLSTFYYKVKKDNIPVIKQGKHLYIYRDELDKWLKKIRDALNSPTENAVDFLDNFKLSLYTSEIVVFT